MFDLFKEIIEDWKDYDMVEKAYWSAIGLLFSIGFLAFSWWYWVGMFNATDNFFIAFGVGFILYLVLGAIIALVTAPLMTLLSLSAATITGQLLDWLNFIVKHVHNPP